MNRPELYFVEENGYIYKALPSQVKQNKGLFVQYNDYKELDNNFKDLEKDYFLLKAELQRIGIFVKPHKKSFLR